MRLNSNAPLSLQITCALHTQIFDFSHVTTKSCFHVPPTPPPFCHNPPPPRENPPPPPGEKTPVPTQFKSTNSREVDYSKHLIKKHSRKVNYILINNSLVGKSMLANLWTKGPKVRRRKLTKKNHSKKANFHKNFIINTIVGRPILFLYKIPQGGPF